MTASPGPGPVRGRADRSLRQGLQECPVQQTVWRSVGRAEQNTGGSENVSRRTQSCRAFQHPEVARPGSQHRAQRRRVNPRGSWRGLAWGGRLRRLQSKAGPPLPLPSPSLSAHPAPPLTHQKQAPPLLSGDSSLASRAPKHPQERTEAGRGACREDQRREMQETCSPWHGGSSGRRLGEMPGKA